TGVGCFVLCVAAGVFGGLCLGIPTACILTGLVSALGHARPASARYARRRDDPDDYDYPRRPAAPYTLIGPTVVCNRRRTAAPAPSHSPPRRGPPPPPRPPTPPRTPRPSPLSSATSSPATSQTPSSRPPTTGAGRRTPPSAGRSAGPAHCGGTPSRGRPPATT